VGFTINSIKRFVIPDKPECEEFKVYKIDNCKHIECFSGKITEEYTGSGIGYFTEVKEPGDYYIKCGEHESRRFVIYDGVYKHPVRVMLSYFTYQRCGDSFGWAGKCHMDDGYIKETGEHIDLSGGYHQSCDLRKSPSGVTIGLYAMARSAVLNKSTSWYKLFEDEIIYACEYYVKLIGADGIMKNTLNAPHGWSGREFYNSPCPASGQWCATRLLAIASALVPEKKGVYLETALRSWDYLNSERRQAGKYHHPEEPPHGMDKEEFFSVIYKDSIFDRAYKVSCATDFYRATNDKKWLEYVKEAENIDVCENAYMSFCGYSHLTGGVMAYVDAYELCGLCEDKIRTVAETYLRLSKNDIWRKIPTMCSREFLGETMPNWGGKVMTYADSMSGCKEICNGYVYKRRDMMSVTGAAMQAVFLVKAGRILNDSEYINSGQYLADYIMGANPMDGSHIECVGYNQAERGVYGQFFPSTPQIPGAVNIGFTENGIRSEYDMPAVGITMWLLSELDTYKK